MTAEALTEGTATAGRVNAPTSWGHLVGIVGVITSGKRSSDRRPLCDADQWCRSHQAGIPGACGCEPAGFC